MYVPTGAHTFANYLESVLANFSTINNVPHADRERSGIVNANDNKVKRHLKYLFVNPSKQRRMRYVR